MAISFKDSLKSNADPVVNSVKSIDPPQKQIPSVMVEDAMPLVYSNGSDDWQKVSDKGYEFYDDYNDEDYSTIDINKNIVLNSSQINITQETNSQYIPFIMPRYYDGFDLSSTKLQFYYVNRLNHFGIDYPVNVYYNDDQIKFAWLVDDNATSVDGKLKFEIQALGANSKGESYTWKSKTNESMNVLKSLTGAKMIEPSETWKDDFLSILNGRVDIATNAANNAASAIVTIEELAKRAEDAAADARSIADNLMDGIHEDVVTTVANVIDAAVDDKITTVLSSYYDKDTVDSLLNNIDISDQLDKVKDQIDNLDGLANFNVEYDGSKMSFYNGDTIIKEIKINSDPTDEWTASYTEEIEEKIGTAISGVQSDFSLFKESVESDVSAIQDELEGFSNEISEDYYKKTDTFNRDEIESMVSNVTVDLSGYATEDYVAQAVAPISGAATKNTSDIGLLNQAVGELQDAIASVDTSARLTYDIVYNDLEDENSGENVLVLYEIENEGQENEVKSPKKKYTIAGGSGGSSASNDLKIYYVKDDGGNNITRYVYTTEDVGENKAVVRYDFYGTDSVGDSISSAVGTWQLRKGKSGAWTTVSTVTLYPGTNLEFNVSKHLFTGSYELKLIASDDSGGFASKTWDVQQIEFKIVSDDSDFNDKITYPIAPVTFNYTPYGAIQKDIHFILDGSKIDTITTTSSGISTPYILHPQEHGAHLLEVYMTAKMGESTIESNHILKDIVWFDQTSSTPVISTTYQNFTTKQYDTTNIVYAVFDPNTETPTVTISVNDNVVASKILTTSVDTFQFKTDVIGEHIITITCGETVKTLIATVEKLDIKLEPVTAGLVFDFNPYGMSNNDADRIWSDGDISMSVSENFDWVNGGYQIDNNGDQYFCIKAGTSAVINYNLFADDAKKNGKEFKIVFKSTNVQSADATFLHCVDNTTDTNHIGVKMNVHEAYVYGQAGKLDLPYSENDIIEFEFNISKSTEAVPMVMGYEDGVSTRPMVYDDSFDFTQNTPKFISLGSDQCDLHIYRFKVYNTSLSARGILNNFIADARNADEMIARYNRNQIYDENQNLDPDTLAEKCPWLRVYKVSAPYFTNNKSDKVPGTSIQQIYKDGDPTLDNWTCYDCMHSGQGTSSNNYGAAGRNLDFIMNKSGVDGVKPKFILGDGSEATKITLTRTSVPTAYLNAKVNIASSNNMTNALLANRYNEFNPYKRKFIRDEGVDTSIIKDTMEFHNCVIFIQETNEDVSTHREFADNEWHFYAIGNIGDSKKTDDTRLTDMDDKYECCVEIMDVEYPLSDWPVDTMYNAMGYKVDEKTEEKIYIWAKDENLGILYEKIDDEYVLTHDTAVDLSKTYYVDILEHDDFSEDFTYGWRYLYEGDDEEENAEVFNFCKQKWIEMYRFVTTSSDDEFRAHIGDYFVMDSVLYYYLFTTRYCMVDNRAKNSFWHYGKTGEFDSDGNPIRKWDLCWDYDNDTALGLNNYGKQVYRHGLEDTDFDENGKEVFRESDSTFFCRIRDLFPGELRSMFNTLESKNTWHAESLINKADEWQKEFPEELWRLDTERKYIRTYTGSFINGEADNQFLVNMCNGRMRYHRRQWERSQEKYMASKYQSSAASSDGAIIRCAAPSGNLVVEPNYKLKLIPYDYMYLNVQYGTQSPIQMRVTDLNKEYEIPFSGASTDIINIFSSSIIKSFGDLSACYPATVDTSKAKKIKDLIIGNSTEVNVGGEIKRYDNPYFTTLTLGSNDLLEVLNVENVSGLTQTLDVSGLHNLKELYAHGTNASGVTMADGGKMQIAELPTVGSMTMRNLQYLTDLNVSSFDNLTKLVVENCDTIDLLSIVNSAPNLNRVRLIGVDWNLEDTALLERVYLMSGVDKDGFNAERSVLSGSVRVPVIRDQQMYEYKLVWPDLEIIPGSTIKQFAVTFCNDDGSVLETQYIDIGGSAVDPSTRQENRLIPSKESTVSHQFTFAGWDASLTGVYSDRVITATYTSELRTYTVKYVSMGVVEQESTGKYGEHIPYEKETPTYTKEEADAYSFYLFDRWDKSGFVDGDKTITAKFDKFVYSDTAFDGKELKDFTPVELYAMSKMNIANSILEGGEKMSIMLGNDVTFDDVEEEVLISEKMEFNGSNHFDTGVKLFEEDRDFVLAIDYEFLDGNSTNAVLAQCFQSNGSNGFKLWYIAGSGSSYTGSRFTWGASAAENLVAKNKREMVVVRHIKGSNNIMIYNSNLDGDGVSVVQLDRNKMTVGDCPLVFGCARHDDGAFENHAIGNVYWCKLWHADLGDDVCRKVAVWPHEEVGMQVAGFKRYYLTDNPSQRCSFTLLATDLLARKQRWSPSGVNSSTGGFGASHLHSVLNTRVYQAISDRFRPLIKMVDVPSSLGNKSTDVANASCFVTVPSCIEVDPTMTSEPYVYEGTTFAHLSTDESRKRAHPNGTYYQYWLRSPNVSHASYVWQVNANGALYGFNLPYNEAGVLIEISI